MGTEMALGVAVVEVIRLQSKREMDGRRERAQGGERKPVAQLTTFVGERLRLGVYGLRASKPAAASSQA